MSEIKNVSMQSNPPIDKNQKQGKFCKRHIAAMAIGTAIAIGGIAATILTGGAFAVGTIGVSLGAALFATSGCGIACGVLITAAGIKKSLEHRNVIKLNTNAQNKTEGTTVKYKNQNHENDTKDKIINFIDNNSENIATCMACDGTQIISLDNNGNLLKVKENEQTAIAKDIEKAKDLTDNDLDKFLENITNEPAAPEWNKFQSLIDLRRNCKTFNIYGTILTYNDNKIEGTQNKTFTDLIIQVFNTIDNKLSNDGKDEADIKNTKRNFLRQILKYPGQALEGTATMTYSKYLYSIYENQNDTLLMPQASGQKCIVSLQSDGTITVESTHNFVITSANNICKNNEGTTISLQNQLCVEENITSTIPLSEGIKNNDSKFTVTTNQTKFYTANVHYKNTNTIQLIEDNNQKQVIEMEYTNENGTTPTFTIKKPVEGSEEMTTVKTLQLLNNTWKEAEKLEE